MGSGFIADATSIRDAVDLQHRHPLLWAALGGGRGRVWRARRLAAELDRFVATGQSSEQGLTTLVVRASVGGRRSDARPSS